MSKVRIINDKTGVVKFVSPFVADQTETLTRYGFRVEDLPTKKAVVNETITLEATKPIVSQELDLEFKELSDGASAFDNSIEQIKVKGKPGPKPKTELK